MKSTLKRVIIGSPVEHHVRNAWQAYRRIRPGRGWANQELNDRYDEETAEIARRVLTGSGVCVDAGAHTGMMLQRFRAASPSSQFVAIEPIPGLAEHLHRNFPDATVHQVALADYEGETEFRHVLDSAQESSLFLRPEREDGRSVRTYPVRVRRLDDLLDLDGPKIEFLKLDVEGAELAALRGAPRLLAEHRPVVVLECGRVELHDIAALVAASGYRLYTLRSVLGGDAPLADAAEIDAARAAGDFYYAAVPD